MALVYTTSESVLAALAAVLASVTGMQEVMRQYFEKLDNYIYPGAFLNDVRREREQLCADCIRVNHFFTAVVFSRSENRDLSTVLNALIEDTMTKVQALPTLGGIVKWVKVLRIDTDEGFLEPHCAAIFQVQALYLTQK